MRDELAGLSHMRGTFFKPRSAAANFAGTILIIIRLKSGLYLLHFRLVLAL